jgi:hypothetical protein
MQWLRQCENTIARVGGDSPAHAGGLLRNAIFLVLAIVMLCLWFAAWVAFKMAGAAIHIVLVFAVIFFVIHFLRGRRAV